MAQTKQGGIMKKQKHIISAKEAEAEWIIRKMREGMGKKRSDIELSRKIAMSPAQGRRWF